MGTSNLKYKHVSASCCFKKVQRQVTLESSKMFCPSMKE